MNRTVVARNHLVGLPPGPVQLGASGCGRIPRPRTSLSDFPAETLQRGTGRLPAAHHAQRRDRRPQALVDEESLQEAVTENIRIQAWITPNSPHGGEVFRKKGAWR